MAGLEVFWVGHGHCFDGICFVDDSEISIQICIDVLRVVFILLYLVSQANVHVVIVLHVWIVE